MAAYTSPTSVAAYLGLTLTSPQQAAVTALAPAVTDWIDHYLGQSWQDSTITDEAYRSPCPGPGWGSGVTLYLRTRPVVSVQQVRRRALTVGATPVVLATSAWELFDPAAGLLLVQAQWDDLLLVDYTVDATPPARIGLAATILAVRFLGPLLQPGSANLESVSVGGGELAVRFAQYVDTDGVPPEVLNLLGARVPVVA